MANRKKSKKAAPSDRTTPVGRDLLRVHRFAEDLLARQGLSGWSVFWVETFDDNKYGGGVTIGHSTRIIFSAAQMAMLTPDARRDAVRHEVAHALVGVAAGHSDVWEQKAKELGSLGLDTLGVRPTLYPWRGYCFDGHEVVSVEPPEANGILCEDGSHDEPVLSEWFERNAKSRAFDPGVQTMVETYPEPASEPEFQVGDTVYVIPFGDDMIDNAELTVIEVRPRTYVTQGSIMEEEIIVRHEMVRAAREPQPDASER